MFGENCGDTILVYSVVWNEQDNECRGRDFEGCLVSAGAKRFTVELPAEDFDWLRDQKRQRGESANRQIQEMVASARSMGSATSPENRVRIETERLRAQVDRLEAALVKLAKPL